MHTELAHTGALRLLACRFELLQEMMLLCALLLAGGWPLVSNENATACEYSFWLSGAR